MGLVPLIQTYLKRKLLLGQVSRLTKHHINLQVHLIVEKFNAALSEGRSIY